MNIDYSIWLLLGNLLYSNSEAQRKEAAEALKQYYVDKDKQYQLGVLYKKHAKDEYIRLARVSEEDYQKTLLERFKV